MFYRIDSVEPIENYNLLVHFESGETKLYNVADLFEKWEMFRPLEQISGLFELVRVDPGGYGISWNDDIDISADELFQNGSVVR